MSAILRSWLWTTVFSLNGGLDVRGELPSGGCVVVANHSSHADGPSLLAALDAGHRPVVAAAADYWFDRRSKAMVCRTLVAGFAVHRDGGGYADLAAQIPALLAGRAVVIFPAGSRHSTDGRFHHGAFRLAQQAGVPVVPVRLTGTSALLQHGRPRRGRVLVEIGRPVVVTDPAVDAVATQRILRAAGRDPRRDRADATV